MEERRNPGRFPGFGYLDSDDCAGRLSVVDSGGGHCILCNFAKEVFGGTGMNVFNVALVTRAFLFFAYPTKMSGDAVWVSGDTIFGLGQAVDGLTVATCWVRLPHRGLFRHSPGIW